MSDTTSAPKSANDVPAPVSKPVIIDDKSPHCIPFIVSQLSNHRASSPNTPFFIGLNGVQGAGKTTLVSALSDTLTAKGLSVLVCSIDDLYLRHEDQVRLAEEHADNKLVQHRGEPGTHDMDLATSLFTALQAGKETQIPEYDKSLFSGAGDRVSSTSWKTVNAPSTPPISVIIFEGWCVGFRALPPSTVSALQEAPSQTLHRHKLEHLLFVNEKLRAYDIMTDSFDAFIHIDAQETNYVYEWRLEQEQRLREEKGSGMSDEKVREFVDGYFPAYELYTEGLRRGVVRGKGEGRQLRLVVGRDRRVVDIVTI